MDDVTGWVSLKDRVTEGYRPIKRLGSGGGASVLHSRSTRSSSDVAIKIAHGDPDPEVHQLKIDAIWTEARALQHLAGIPGVTSFIACEGPADEPVLVMERVRGWTFQFILQQSMLTLQQSLQLLARLADVLVQVHRRGVIHRDVKPENVLVVLGKQGPKPVLIDFGLAVFVNEPRPWSESRRVSGSPHYMAPEAFDPDLSPDFGLDIYALGIMLFEICTGRHPFSAENIAELYCKHRMATVPFLREFRPQVRYPDRLERLVQVALEKQQDLRLGDVSVFARELREAIMELGSIGGLPPAILTPKSIELGPTRLFRPRAR